MRVTRDGGYTPAYVETYLKAKPTNIEVTTDKDEYHFKYYLNHDEDLVNARVAIVRTIGMKIEDLGVRSYIRQPYKGVLIGESKEDRYLKSLENASHTELSYKNIDNDEQKNMLGSLLIIFIAH